MSNQTNIENIHFIEDELYRYRISYNHANEDLDRTIRQLEKIEANPDMQDRAAFFTRQINVIQDSIDNIITNWIEDFMYYGQLYDIPSISDELNPILL